MHVRRVSLLFLLFIAGFAAFYFLTKSQNKSLPETVSDTVSKIIPNTNPLSIEFQRAKEYLGSDLQIEEELGRGTNYRQYIASYTSDGLKIFGLLSIPTTPMPDGGYPAIIFNHGYIPPTQYRTTERYVAYFADIANSGYIVFKPDYRGHGSSEGRAEGAYFSAAYITDVLNALSSIKKHPQVNKSKIGMWGHSLGGFLTLRAMVIDKDIKAGAIWGGVVGSYQDMQNEWWGKRNRPTVVPGTERSANTSSRQNFMQRFGAPDNSNFWNEISATTFLADISGPIQLHHGLSDETVPYQLSEILQEKMEKENKPSQLFTYEGSDHDIAQGYSLAMSRSIAFFDKHLKGEE